MTISTQPQGHHSTDTGPQLSAQDVWRAVSRASFAVLSHVTPATVSFPAVATVHSGEALHRIPALAKLVPAERRTSCVVVDVRPTGHYVTYGLGVPLLRMRSPARSRARIPVGSPG